MTIDEIEKGLDLSRNRGEWDPDDWRHFALALTQYYKAALSQNSSLESTLLSLQRNASKAPSRSALEAPEASESLLLELSQHQEALSKKQEALSAFESRLEEAEAKLVISNQERHELSLTLEQREKALNAFQTQTGKAKAWQELLTRLLEFRAKPKLSYKETRDLLRQLGASIPKQEEALLRSLLKNTPPPPSRRLTLSSKKRGK